MNAMEPSKVRPMWSKGAGPPRPRGAIDLAGKLECERSPFPLATTRVWLSGLTARAVGNQPTGMNPSMRETLGSVMSMTATLLLSALATNNVLPSGETITASGALPSGESG